MLRFSNKISAALIGCIVIALSAATLVEKYYGSEAAHRYFYDSLWFAALWAAAAGFAAVYFMRQKVRRISVIAMHLSLALILAGALCTKLCGKSGRIILQKGIPAKASGITLPFEISLDTFYTVYYAGTNTPSDYVSAFTICDREAQKTAAGQVSMNKIFSYRSYRFCQASFDASGSASVLSINKDPAGIAVTYFGYILFIVSGFAAMFRRMFCGRKTAAAAVITLLLLPFTLRGENSVQRVPIIDDWQAEKFGGLCILYNGRITSVSVFAHDFTVKLTGKSRIGKINSEQFLASFLFFPEEWQRAALFDIKDPALKKLLNAEHQKASFADFFDSQGRYKLADIPRTKETAKLNDKINAINLLHSGALLKMFPMPVPAVKNTPRNLLQWYSPTENIPQSERQENIKFAKTALTNIYAALRKENDAAVFGAINDIEDFQTRNADGFLPSRMRLKTEVLYLKYSVVPLLFKLNLALGILCVLLLSAFRNKKYFNCLFRFSFRYAVFAFCLLTLSILLRIYISRQPPFAAGFEVMLVMAWTALLTIILLRKRAAESRAVLPFGLIVSGFALLVAHLGINSPQITPLVPVLTSPLLSAHVSVIMISYALLTFAALNSLCALLCCVLRRSKNSVENGAEMFSAQNSMLCLRPAVFLLGTGIFTGAAWANISWGTYWSWDPKETWALITFLVYGLILHGKIKPRIIFHAVVLAAFITVLITYFGVNYFFGGMHSYA